MSTSVALPASESDESRTGHRTTVAPSYRAFWDLLLGTEQVAHPSREGLRLPAPRDAVGHDGERPSVACADPGESPPVQSSPSRLHVAHPFGTVAFRSLLPFGAFAQNTRETASIRLSRNVCFGIPSVP